MLKTQEVKTSTSEFIFCQIITDNYNPSSALRRLIDSLFLVRLFFHFVDTPSGDSEDNTCSAHFCGVSRYGAKHEYKQRVMHLLELSNPINLK